MNRNFHAEFSQLIREAQIAVQETAFLRSRRTLPRDYVDNFDVVRSLSITNEANLIAGENVATGTDRSKHARHRPSSTSARRRSGSDDDSDSDPAPTLELKRRKRVRPEFNEFPKEGFLRLWQVLQIIPISKSSWWAGCKTGRFPQPIKLSPRTTVWRVEDIRMLLASVSQGGL